MALSIGQLSQRTRVLVPTIRYYEQEGLIDPPQRSPGGHRQYGIDAVERLQFIRRARELGFTLDEVRQLIGFSTGARRCRDTHDLAVQHLEQVGQKIRDLRQLEKALKSLTDQCRQTPDEECPLFDALRFGSAAADRG